MKTTKAAGLFGYHDGNKIKRPKRHIVTYTQRYMVHAVSHPPTCMIAIRRHPWLRHIFADGGYADDKLRQALCCKVGRWTIETIKRSDHAKSFEVLPRRWVA